MNRASPEMRNIAKCLIAAEGTKPAGFSVGEKLRANLATLMGNGGYHALLSRALALSQAEVSWLRTVHVNPDGTLAGVEEHRVQLDSDELSEGRVVLLAQLLGLLVAFIGENLTLRLLHEVCPNAKLDGLEFGTEGKKNEKRK
jgi:hypothetical protein